MKDIALPKSLEVLSDIFAAGGHTLYLVGGYVRNLTLGLSGGDFDVCSDIHPQKAADMLRDAGLNVIEKAIELGTIEVHLDMDGQKHVFEHTTFRRDIYPGGGEHRPDKVAFTDDMGEDARRRDFTVNALYLDIAKQRVIDPTGRGLDDIEARVIKAAAQDPLETIRDDGLRIMRMARFAAELGFEVSKELLACAKAHVHLLVDISAERKCDELVKILMADTKYPMQNRGDRPHKTGLDLLRQAGALPYVLPQLCAGDGVAQSTEYHVHDVLGHGIAACAVSVPILPLRLAALLHDIGKPAALLQGGSMHGHDTIGTELAKKEMAALKFDKKTTGVVAVLIENHMFDLEGCAKPKTIRRRAVMLGRDAFSLLIQLRRADFLGSGKEHAAIVSADNWQAELDRMIAQGMPWSVSEMEISGNDIMRTLGIEPSPEVGKLLGMLFKECVMHPRMNQPDILARMATKLVPELLP